jgi:Golgi apparatus protein 1
MRDCLGKFCEGVQPGEGRIYDCLMRHKMEPEMTEPCRQQISRRQALAAQDYRYPNPEQTKPK